MSEFPSKGDEVLDPESFRPQGEYWIRDKGFCLFCRPSLSCRLVQYERPEGVAHCLASLVEGCLDHGLEERLVASESLAGVAGEPYDGGLHFRWRIECPLSHREKVLYVIPRLEQYRKDAVGLCPGLLGDTFRHFFLYHAHYLGDGLLVVEYLEENL